MKTIQSVSNGTRKKYAYETKAVHDLSMIKFERIALIGSIWAYVIPNWGIPGKRARAVNGGLEGCFSAETCPDGLTEHQFAVIKESPIRPVHFFRFRKKAKNDANANVRVWTSTIQKIEEYIQKYQHLIPEPQQDAPSDATEPDPTNISN